MNFAISLMIITPYLTFLLWFLNAETYLVLLGFSKKFHRVLVALLSVNLVLLFFTNTIRSWLLVLTAEIAFFITSFIPLNFLIKELRLRGFVKNLPFPVLIEISSYLLLNDLNSLPVVFTLFSMSLLSFSLRVKRRLRGLFFLIPLIPLYWKSESVSMLILSGILLYDMLSISKELEKELEKL